MSEQPGTPGAPLPILPTLSRAAVDVLRRARRAWRGTQLASGPRPAACELLSLWLVQRLPGRSHRFLEPRQGAAPVRFVVPPRRRP